MPPLRLLVNRPFRDAAQTSNQLSVNAADPRGHLAPRRLIHERHELVREPRHCAADAYPAHIGAAPNTADPAAFGHVAFHYGPPAADLHKTLRRAIFCGEVPFLVIAGSVTAFVHGLTKKPLGAQMLIQWNHRCLAGGLI